MVCAVVCVLVCIAIVAPYEHGFWLTVEQARSSIHLVVGGLVYCHGCGVPACAAGSLRSGACLCTCSRSCAAGRCGWTSAARERRQTSPSASCDRCVKQPGGPGSGQERSKEEQAGKGQGVGKGVKERGFWCATPGLDGWVFVLSGLLVVHAPTLGPAGLGHAYWLQRALSVLP